jgi:cytidine deaminase
MLMRSTGFSAAVQRPGSSLSPLRRLQQWPELFKDMHLDALIRSATDAGHKSYSPYSRFRVGAAVLAAGSHYIGCNIENASYGLTVCAERVAIWNGIANGRRQLDALAVNCLDVKLSDPVESRLPCGACRQVMKEMLRPDSPIVITDVGIFFIDELLPLPFCLPRAEV